jgi:hypothetical protein
VNWYIHTLTQPTHQIYVNTVDDIAFTWGCYNDGSSVKSSTTVGTYQITNGAVSGQLDFRANSGVAAGTAASLVTAMTIIASSRIVNFPIGITLLTTGGTPATLATYETATGTLSVSQALTQSNTVNYKITQVGKLITIFYTSTISGTCISGNIIYSAIPSRFFPATSCYEGTVIKNNAANAASVGLLGTDGTFTTFGTVVQANFTAAACQVYPFAITYTL